MAPKVSIIVPVYNVEKYLPRCLDSLVNQTLKDIEIICVNDGSTDGSLAILQQYAAKDKRIKIIDKENSGPGDCRNRGIEAAKGEFIAFVDSDDWVELNTYEETYKKAKEHNVPLLSFNANIVNEKLKKSPKIYYETTEKHLGNWENIAELIFNNPFHSWHFIYEKSFLQKNDIRFPPLSLCEDVPFVLKALFCAEKILFVPDAFYNYFMRGNSLIHRTTDKIFDILEIIPLCKNILCQYAPKNTALENGLSFWKKIHLFRLSQRLKHELNPILQNYYIAKISPLFSPEEFHDFLFNCYNRSENLKLFGIFTILSKKHILQTTKIRLFKKLTILKIERYQYEIRYYFFGLLLFTKTLRYF